MVDILNLYVDDSGSRRLDRAGVIPPPRDWFGLGGVLIAEKDETVARASYTAFVAKFPEIGATPLHSVKIRNRSDGFNWLRRDHDRANAFYTDLTTLICGTPALCIAAVIDRPAYHVRYKAMISATQTRWLLCKTAFSILLERAVKRAIETGHRLRVLVERGDEKTDKRMHLYYDELRASGMPFSPNRMQGYAPLTPDSFATTLYEFRTKNKSSPLMQLADLCLYPMCRAPYDPTYRPYSDLIASQKLIDVVFPPNKRAERGIKYSCFLQQTIDALPHRR